MPPTPVAPESAEAVEPSGTPAELTLETFVAEYRRRMCERLSSCEPLHVPPLRTAERWCHPRAVDVKRDWPLVPRLDGTCDPGEYSFDPETARRCLDELARADCRLEPADPHLDPCLDAIVRGQLRCLPGRCPEGESCDRICGPSCELSCGPRRAEGEPCSVVLGPFPSACRLDLRCVGATCVRLPNVGEPCTDECDRGARCVGGRCVADGRPGGPCSVQCLGDHHCVPGPLGIGRCVEGAQPGERCVDACPVGGPPCEALPCARGGRCVEGVCRRISVPGGRCDEERVCPRAFHCADEVCTPDPVVGERCSAAIPCAQGRCVGGVCRGEPPGARCDSRGEAPLGLCASGRASDCHPLARVCAEYATVGEPCEDVPCELGLECDRDSGVCRESCWCGGFCPPGPPS